MTFNDLLLYLNETGEFRINLHDCSGLLSNAPFSIDRTLRFHDQPFCDAAKATIKGYRLCVGCKKTVCKRAIRRAKPFFGICPYGLFELVYPITDHGKVLCLLFIGNCVRSVSDGHAKAENACMRTDVDVATLTPFFESLPRANEARMLGAARIIEETVRLLLIACPTELSATRPTHWVARSMAEYAEENFRAPITLKQMSELYFMNEKYLGKLFARQNGMTFHQYLTKLRLQYAAKLLRSTELPILEVAMESGFHTISYFNRSFSARYGETPSLYRLKNQSFAKKGESS